MKWSKDATAELEAALRLASREIGLLREFRTRLIADVVTGKLYVRKAAARLPDEAEEPQPVDEMAPDLAGDEGTEYAISDEELLEVAEGQEA